MLKKSNQQTPDLLFGLGLFYLSNIPAFIAVIWLNPQLLLIELLFWLAVVALSIWSLNKQATLARFFEALKNGWIILPFLSISGLSIFWSVYWEVSLYRWLILLSTIIAGGFIGFRYNLREIVKMLSVLGIFILFISSIFVFFEPTIGVMNYYSIQGAWKGLYWHKNHMGLIAAFINILFIVNIIDGLQSKRPYLAFWGLYLYSLFFIYKTDSVAAYLTTISIHAVIMLTFLWIRFRKNIRSFHYLAFIVFLALASLTLYMNMDYFLGLFNRNASLTGRIPMWTHLFDTYLSQRPFLGYGFNAFWYLDPHRVAMQKAAGYPDPIVIADNGFIDILVNTGILGLTLFSIFYFVLWWRSIKYAGKAKDIIGLFPVILMSYTLLANISWSLIFENENFFMLIMISVLFRISREYPQEPNKQYQAS